MSYQTCALLLWLLVRLQAIEVKRFFVEALLFNCIPLIRVQSLVFFIIYENKVYFLYVYTTTKFLFDAVVSSA
jgi:hypothetical protein